MNLFPSHLTPTVSTVKTTVKSTTRSIFTAATKKSKILEFQTSAVVEFTDAVLEGLLDDSENFLEFDMSNTEPTQEPKQRGKHKNTNSGTKIYYSASILLTALYMLI